MLNTDSRISDPKFDNLPLVKRALEIWRAQGGTFSQAFIMAEREQGQQPSAQRIFADSLRRANARKR